MKYRKEQVWKLRRLLQTPGDSSLALRGMWAMRTRDAETCNPAMTQKHEMKQTNLCHFQRFSQWFTLSGTV
jgi:hypothetical protein